MYFSIKPIHPEKGHHW